jgi:hypothetical protein
MNRNTIVSNGTVFGVWPLARSIPVVGGLLVMALVLMQPEASRGLGLPERIAFWVINVGLALAALYSASWLVLPRIMNRLPAWLSLLVAGVGGALLLAPVGVLVELVLPASLHPIDDGDEWLDAFAGRGWWQATIAEFLESAPEVLGFWMIINLPFLASRRSASDTSDPDGADSGPTDVDKSEASRYAEAARAEFIGRLPEALGTNVLAISSDLHYLHVYTDRGRCMILGSLQQAAEAMGETGLRVHRAHWVARRAIVKIVKNGSEWSCLLTNDLKVPISRRNKSTVAGWFGHSTRVISVRKGDTEAA